MDKIWITGITPLSFVDRGYSYLGGKCLWCIDYNEGYSQLYVEYALRTITRTTLLFFDRDSSFFTLLANMTFESKVKFQFI